MDGMDGFDPARLDLLAHGFTVADIRDLRVPRWLADSVAGLTGVEDPVVRWIPVGAERVRSAAWSSLGERDLEEVYAAGAIALGDPEETLFDAGLRWYRLSPGARRHAADAPWLQNELTLRVDSARLADPGFREAYVRWCAEAAGTLRATYLTAGSTLVYSVHLPHAEGLGAGLRDVYWLNVFGPEFCDVIGVDRLLSAPAARTERVGPEHVLVLADDAVLQPPPHGDAREPWPPTRALLDPIADHIGREFFVKPRLEPPAPPVMGLLRGLRHLRAKDSGFDDPAVMAERRPAFDYSAIVAGE